MKSIDFTECERTLILPLLRNRLIYYNGEKNKPWPSLRQKNSFISFYLSPLETALAKTELPGVKEYAEKERLVIISCINGNNLPFNKDLFCELRGEEHLKLNFDFAIKSVALGILNKTEFRKTYKTLN